MSAAFSKSAEHRNVELGLVIKDRLSHRRPNGR
jgi:hypothetical protein